MANYYKTLSCKNLLLSDGLINQKKGQLNLALDGKIIVEIKDNSAFLNSKKILTSADNNFMVMGFGSGIYKVGGSKYLRYKGNSDSGYDMNLRVANIYNTPFPILIKHISIQKGSHGINTINIPSIGYTKTLNGLFFDEDVNLLVPSNSKIFVQVNGEPSLETSVDIYYYKNDNVQPSLENVSISEEIVPTFNEIFTYMNESIYTKYALLFT